MVCVGCLDCGGITGSAATEGRDAGIQKDDAFDFDRLSDDVCGSGEEVFYLRSTIDAIGFCVAVMLGTGRQWPPPVQGVLRSAALTTDDWVLFS